METDNEQQALGVDIIRKAASEPLRIMAKNAGESPDIIQANVEVQTGNWGYNFANDLVEDMIEAGILDPVKVTRSALQNAASAAGTLITTNYAIVQVE